MQTTYLTHKLSPLLHKIPTLLMKTSETCPFKNTLLSKTSATCPFKNCLYSTTFENSVLESCRLFINHLCFCSFYASGPCMGMFTRVGPGRLKIILKTYRWNHMREQTKKGTGTLKQATTSTRNKTNHTWAAIKHRHKARFQSKSRNCNRRTHIKHIETHTHASDTHACVSARAHTEVTNTH